MDFLLQNLRELRDAFGAVGYWIAYATAVVLLWTCLLRLHRVQEKHHGYYGAVLCLIPWWPAQLVGWVLLLDDLYQHWKQALALENGRVIPADFSPIHVAYVRTYRWVVRHFGDKSP